MHKNNFYRQAGQFFKDKDGKWTLAQFPNTLLFIWIVLTIVIWLLGSIEIVDSLRILQKAILIAWAYLELIAGDSYFRRFLGAGILVFFIIATYLR